MRTDELDYQLPPDLIATEPAQPRDSARLMVIDRKTGSISHHQVRDLPDLGIFRPGDLLVFNQSKVVPAYVELTRTATGGHVTGLYLSSPQSNQWSILLESRGKLQEGEWLHFDDESSIQLLTRCENGRWIASLHSPLSTLELLNRKGSPPLPPYIRKQRQAMQMPPLGPADRDRYNTVYASQSGSVAAPTAGLHFTEDLLSRLEAIGVQKAMVTLHVGLGTFAPIRTENVEDHPIHNEICCVPRATLEAIAHTRAAGGRVIPVGTTTVRTLESLPRPMPSPEDGDVNLDTRLFITPAPPGQRGFEFQHTDILMTNFHLPRSSLLALVAALPGVGVPNLLSWYRQAVENRYRFYSYGDAMLLA